MLTNHAEKTRGIQQESPGLWKQRSKSGGYLQRRWQTWATPEYVSVNPSMVVSRNQNKNCWVCVFKQNNWDVDYMWGDKTHSTETCQVTQHDMALVQGQHRLVCMVWYQELDSLFIKFVKLALVGNSEYLHSAKISIFTNFLHFFVVFLVVVEAMKSFLWKGFLD